MANDSDIRRYSTTELAARRARGESQTDMARVRAMTDDEVERAIAGDPDEPADDSWLEHAVLVTQLPKKPLSLRVDADVLEWFKRQGPGYQTRMNAVLRAFVEHANKRGR